MAESARQVEAGKAAPEHSPAAPAVADVSAETAHGRVLALQRAAGNRAVTALLQRQAVERQLGEVLHPVSVRNALFSVPFEQQPPWLPQAGEQPSGGEQPAVPAGEGPETPRPGQASDAFRAVMEIPAIDGALSNLRGRAAEHVQRNWGQLSAGERGALVTSAATIGGATLAGVLSDQKSREFALQQLHGRDLPVPGVDGLNVQFRTQREDLGVMFSFDVGRHLPTSWGFGPSR